MTARPLFGSGFRRPTEGVRLRILLCNKTSRAGGDPSNNVRLGVFLPSQGPDPDAAALASLAREAEARGFDSLWVLDHVL